MEKPLVIILPSAEEVRLENIEFIIRSNFSVATKLQMIQNELNKL